MDSTHTRLNRPTHTHTHTQPRTHTYTHYLLLKLGPLWRHILLVALIIPFSLGLLESCQQLSACLVAHLTFIYAKMWNHLWNLPSMHSSSSRSSSNRLRTRRAKGPAQKTKKKKDSRLAACEMRATKNYALLGVRKKRVRESSFCRQSNRRGVKNKLASVQHFVPHSAAYRKLQL